MKPRRNDLTKLRPKAEADIYELHGDGKPLDVIEENRNSIMAKYRCEPIRKLRKHLTKEDIRKLQNQISRKNARAERGAKILKMRDNGLTLQQIGKEFGLSRERVRQIEINYLGLPARGQHKLPDLKFKCKLCGKEFMARYRERTYCSPRCFSLYLRSRGKSESERRRDKNRYQKERYQRFKDDPEFRKKVREYNRRALLKRKKLKELRKQEILSLLKAKGLFDGEKVKLPIDGAVEKVTFDVGRDR